MHLAHPAGKQLGVLLVADVLWPDMAAPRCAQQLSLAINPSVLRA